MPQTEKSEIPYNVISCACSDREDYALKMSDSENGFGVEEDEDDTTSLELDENGEINPAKVQEAVLNLLEELEDSGSEAEGDSFLRKYHNLPWRGRCWRVSVCVSNYVLLC